MHCRNRFIEKNTVLLLLAALLLTGCTGAPAPAEEPEPSTAVTEAQDNSTNPRNLVGNWERIYTEVEGDRQASAAGMCTIQITGTEEKGLYITYTEADRPDWSYADIGLTVEPADHGGYLEGCTWKATVNTTANNTIHEVYLLADGTLLMVNRFTVDGAPMVSYEGFCRGG